MVGRSKNGEYPKIWTRFEKTSKKDGILRKFRVQEITENMYDDVIEFMIEYFLKEEPFVIATDCLNDQKAFDQILKFWRYNVLPQGLSVVCFEEVDPAVCTFRKPEIVGVNYLLHLVKDHEVEKEFQEPDKLHGLIEEIESNFDIFNAFKVNEYMGACGLAVNPKYRGMNIGAEILHARVPICKEMGIKVSETMFTAVGSQVLASKAGFKTYMDLKFDDMAQKLNIKFPDGFDVMKVMVKSYD